MKVRELKQLLDGFDDNAFVVINGIVVAGIEEIHGRSGGDKHWPDTFRKVDAGRDKAVVFLVHAEFSDGSQGLTHTHS
jgi:hypothetical protein